MGDSGSLSLGRDARRHRADHRPDPGPAAHRADLRHRDGCRSSSRSATSSSTGGKRIFRMTPAPPPLRARRLGRGEDHAPLLDRRDPRRAARRDAVPRLDPPAAVTTMTTTGRSTSTPLTLDGVARRRASRPAGDASSGFARSGIALARFLADAGRPGDGLRRPRRPPSSASAIAALEGRPVDLRARARTSTRRRPGPAPRSSRPRPRSTPTTRRPSRGSGRAPALVARARRRRRRRARARRPRSTCSCGCAPRRRSASPARRARRRRRR